MMEKIEALIYDKTSEDYWYDVSLFLCQELINNFSDIEWRQLSEKVSDYSESNKIRIVECLADVDNENSRDIILQLSKTESRDLFIVCIDSLRDMNLSSLSCDDKKFLVEKIKYYSDNASQLEMTIFHAIDSSISRFL